MWSKKVAAELILLSDAPCPDIAVPVKSHSMISAASNLLDISEA